MSLAVKTEKKSFSFDDMTIMYKRFLRIIGILPFEGRDFSYLGSKLLLPYFFIWSFVYWSMIVFYSINEKKLPTVDTICEIVMVSGVCTRYYLLVLRRLELTQLLDESHAIWELCDGDGRRAVRQFEQKIRLLFQFLFGSSILCNIMYFASAITLTLSATLHNDTQTRVLPFKWYTQDGANLWPGYKINFALQALVGYSSCIVVTSVDTAAPLLIMIGSGYFRALRYRLLRISQNKDETSYTNFELIACIQLHQRILNFCSRIEKITRTLFFVQILGTVYNLSLSGLKLVGTDPDKYKFLPVVCFLLVQLFICQWAPDHLINESAAISTAAYFVSVTWMRHRLGKLLVLIIARSQRPIQMTAAGIVTLSLENFRCMLTSAVSFFTVLRNVNH